MWVDSVRSGEMVRQVRGSGTLVPEHVRFVSALVAGRVDRVSAHPAQTVGPETILLELSNPDVEIQALQAEQQLTAARATLAALRTTLESQRLAQEGLVASTRTEYAEAQRRAMGADSLLQLNLIARNEAALARDKAIELETRLRVEQERFALIGRSIDSQIPVQETQVAHLREIARFQENLVHSLHVRAGDSGVVSDLTLQLGQYVLAGTLLAKVVQPGKLLAAVHVPETQAKDVVIGQRAAIDTRNGIIGGHVSRIDPNAVNGSVAVDITLDSTPPAARPDLSVDATIEIERLPHVLYTGRPAYGQPNSTVGLFKLDKDGRYAIRVQVEVGRSSMNAIEILRGLAARDSVVLSDMSQFANVDRVRITR
jgi:multidrug resistance efflux pump